jgi:hypothetical protein
MNQVVKRMKRPTPKFFKMLRTVGLAVAAVGTAVATAPIALPAIIVKAAGYLVVAGTVASTVSQTAVKNERS